MKKIAALILLLLYFSVSTGVLVNIHYCMGSLRSIDFTISKGDTCSRCGMKNKTGCCHEDCKIIKLGVDQQMAKAITNNFALCTWSGTSLFQRGTNHAGKRENIKNILSFASRPAFFQYLSPRQRMENMNSGQIVPC
jgi:hypothetical protein